MSGSSDLRHLLASMSPEPNGETFVFVAAGDDADHPDLRPIMQFKEAEGLTLIVTRKAAEEAGISYAFPCRMITLNIHSSLEAVGFLAAVTTHLAALDVGVNAVSGFFHDHLFVPEDRVDDVLAALSELLSQHSSD